MSVSVLFLQTSLSHSMELLEDPGGDMVDQMATLLGLRKVGHLVTNDHVI